MEDSQPEYTRTPFHVVFTAAHAGFSGRMLPLGGGEAVANRLAQLWSSVSSFPLTLLGAGQSGPAEGVDYLPVSTRYLDQQLSGLGELDYARFCLDFETETTRFVLQRQAALPDGHRLAVLSNDLSEGPDFRQLATHAIPTAVIFHVDVVDYFCRIYLHGRVSPEVATRFYDNICRRGWEKRLPAIARLVFGKQRDAVECAALLIVPSSGMAELLMRCYPRLTASRVKVIPWGCWVQPVPPEDIKSEERRLKAIIAPSGQPFLLAMSRISPEKGQDLLLEALRIREKMGRKPITLVVAGEAAFMRGKNFLRKIQRQSRRLHSSRVFFVGHAHPAMKQALFEMADLYVFPSRHESYGLTLCEAMAAGLPVVTTRHYSAQDLVAPDRGIIVELENPQSLADGIDQALGRTWTSVHTTMIPLFDNAARHLACALEKLIDNWSSEETDPLSV